MKGLDDNGNLWQKLIVRKHVSFHTLIRFPQLSFHFIHSHVKMTI
jgi:hypothetical protein